MKSGLERPVQQLFEVRAVPEELDKLYQLNQIISYVYGIVFRLAMVEFEKNLI